MRLLIAVLVSALAVAVNVWARVALSLTAPAALPFRFALLIPISIGK